MSKPTPKPWIMDIHPYIPGKSTTDSGAKAIKLSSNENPLGTSDAARATFAAHAGQLERYPDADAALLREEIARHNGLDPARIIYGNGSDEVLHMAAGAFAGPGDEIIYVKYGFAVYEIATRRVGATPVIAPDKDYATDVDAILACVTDKTRIIFVANPNNPTSTYTARADIARLHAALPGDVLLVLDHAYAEYIDEGEDDGGMTLAMNSDNILITRTFSKIYGLAAERIGWGYAAAPIIEAMHRIRLPFSITSAGQNAAIAALKDQDFVARSRAHNAKWRSWFTDEVAKLGNKGLRTVESKANFLLILFEGKISAETAYKGLMERGYIVRWLPGQGLGQGLRITIGTEEETRGVAAAIREIVGADA
jgi:histidinol-phosphate aminotransferase